MAINLSDNININSPKILDSRYGPWASVNDANTNVLSLQRRQGLTVGILSGTGVVEYWYYSGILDTDLILKTTTSSSPSGDSGLSGLIGVSGLQGFGVSGSTNMLIFESMEVILLLHM